MASSVSLSPIGLSLTHFEYKASKISFIAVVAKSSYRPHAAGAAIPALSPRFPSAGHRTCPAPGSRFQAAALPDPGQFLGLPAYPLSQR